jgi:hypothetical protein
MVRSPQISFSQPVEALQGCSHAGGAQHEFTINFRETRLTAQGEKGTNVDDE